MASVMGLLEVREAAARVRVEELRAEVDRVLAELVDAEAVLERRAIALAEPAEALAAPGPQAEEPVLPVPVPVVVVKGPMAGSVVPDWREGLAVDALAPHYRRLVGVLVAEPGGAGLRAGELAGRLGLERVPAKLQGVRSKAKRLVERGWWAEKLTPSAHLLMTCAGPTRQGPAAGVNTALRETGSVLGVALGSTVFSVCGSYRTGPDFVAGLVPALWAGPRCSPWPPRPCF